MSHKAAVRSRAERAAAELSRTRRSHERTMIWLITGSVQMGEIEKQADAFGEENITVLPIVMNTRDQIAHDMAVNDVKTPFLLDDGTVSAAYGTIGTGIHAGLPGHSFVLIDTEGQQRWYDEYPSMWLAPEELLTEVTKRL